MGEEERERRRKMEVDESAMAPQREVVNPTGTIHYASSESPRGSWFSFSLAAGLAFLETYGWFLLAGIVATSFLMPSLQRWAKRIENNLNGEANRKREADLDRQREQVRKKQAEAFEKRVQQLEEERRNNPSQSERERERRLEEINARAARLGLQPRGQATGESSRNGRPEYNPLMGGDVPRFRTSRRSAPRGG